MIGWNTAGEFLFEDFPVLNDMDLKYVTLGVYQVELANLYHKRFIKKPENMCFFKREDHPGIVRAKVHVS